MRLHRSLIRTGTLTLILVTFAGCGNDQATSDLAKAPSGEATRAPEGEDDAVSHLRDASTCQAGVDAFQRSVHALVLERCVLCHSGNIPQAPAFAVPDVSRSYPVVLSKMNFDDLQNSVFVRTGGNMHCLARGYDCHTGPSDMMSVISSWWEQGEKNCPRKGRYFTETVTVPATIPTRDTGFTPIRIPLAAIDRTFGTAFVELDMQLFAAATEQTPGAYRFRKPRLATSDKNLHVSNIKILINGKFNPVANAYLSVDKIVKAVPMPTVAGAPLPFPVLSSKSLIVGQEKAAGDAVSLSFEVMQEEAPKSCKALPAFKAKVMPVVIARNCQGCHGGAGNAGRAPANQRFNMDLNETQLCDAFLQRTDAHYGMNSPVIDYALRGANQHPRIIPQVGEVTPAWTDWMAMEFAP